MKKSDTLSRHATDWERIDNMKDEDIDLSDSPQITPEMFSKAIVRRGLKQVLKKEQITLLVDKDISAWFRMQGQEYQAIINSVLRNYMDEHKLQVKK